MELTSNSRKILRQRYLLLNEEPEDRFRLVAKVMSRAEAPEHQTYWENRFWKELLEPLNCLPNSPTIANAHLNNACFSACFVMSPADNLNSIYQVLWDSSLVISAGGGMGYGLSDVREKDAPVNNVQRVAGGPIWLLEMLSKNSAGISQGFRPGANMAQMAIDHPDIRSFIHAKDDISQLNNFNISVQIPDAFMQAVINRDKWNLISRYDGRVVETVDAYELWQEIVHSAHATGDPGVVFIDRIHDTAPNPHLGKIKTSNPCGEEFLEDYGSCCLGSINLGNMVNAQGTFDWNKFSGVIRTATRFLDNVITVNFYAVEAVAQRARNTRRIGLGIMGLADALVYLGIPYNSEAARRFANNVCKFLTDEAKDESRRLAQEKGAYPDWRPGSWSNVPIRNSSVTTIAPTGTISRIAGCSSGIEPYYSRVWKSNLMWDNNGPKLQVYDCPRPIREAILEAVNGDEDKLQTILEHAAVESTEYGPANSQLGHFVRKLDTLYPTAKELRWEEHLEILKACQPHVTNSISKTINMHERVPVAAVERAFWEAYVHKLKAITVYRDGSRHGQVLEDSKTSFPILEELKESEACQFCNGRLIPVNGCTECESCGASKCDL